MKSQKVAKSATPEVLDTLKTNLIRRMVLLRRADAIKRKVVLLNKRQDLIDKKLLELQSLRLSLEFEKNSFRADYDLIERERISVEKQHFSVSAEEGQSALREALDLLGRGEGASK